MAKNETRISRNWILDESDGTLSIRHDETGKEIILDEQTGELSSDRIAALTHLNFPIEDSSDVSGSRSAGVWYQNTTGAPLRVVASYDVAAASDTVRLSVDVNSSESKTAATTRDADSIAPGTSEPGVIAVRAIVPDGSYYYVTLSGATGNASLTAWTEGNIGE